jgi:hypothetical protein
MAIPPSLPDPTRSRYSNGNGHRREPDRGGAPEPLPPQRNSALTFLAPFLGAFAAVIVLALVAGGIYLGIQLLHPSSSSSSTENTAAITPNTSSTENTAPAKSSSPAPAPVTAKVSDPLDTISTWKLGDQPATKLNGDGTADIGWWTKLFYLPKADAVTGYFKAQGLDVAKVVPLHYEDDKESRTITYQVFAQVPAQLVKLRQNSWAPNDPDLRPFEHVVVLNEGLPAGVFWNTQNPAVEAEAGAQLNFACKVRWDKNFNTVTTDRLPYTDSVFTQEQVSKIQSQTSGTIAALQAQVQQISTQVQNDTQAKLAQVAPNPPKPELMSHQWGGDGSGEPTKSAERIGGGTLAGAAGGAAFGAAAGDAGMGAGIGAGVGLLGGLIYDGVSKSNDRKRYEAHVDAVNSERMGDWRAQVKVLNNQRDQIKQDGDNEKQQMIADLVSRIQAANGQIDGLPAPAAPVSDAPALQAVYAAPGADQPSGPITTQALSSSGAAASSVELVDVVNSSLNFGRGNVEVTYPNGQTMKLTQGGKCSDPKLSGKGDVGWVLAYGMPVKDGYVGSESSLVIQTRDGATKRFKPNARFIQKWDFTDDGSSVVIQSMDYHGPESYIKFDLATGKRLDEIDGYKPHDQLPDWAKPYDNN